MDKITLEVTNEQFDLIMKSLELQKNECSKLSKHTFKHPGVEFLAGIMEATTGVSLKEMQGDIGKIADDIDILKGQLLSDKRKSSGRNGCPLND